jgi:hypothetical protein
MAHLAKQLEFYELIESPVYGRTGDFRVIDLHVLENTVRGWVIRSGNEGLEDDPSLHRE